MRTMDGLCAKWGVFLAEILLLLTGCKETFFSDEIFDRDDAQSSNNQVTKDYQIFAVNDLGMHCMDEEYSVFSILPPFNTLHAQLIKTGREPEL